MMIDSRVRQMPPAAGEAFMLKGQRYVCVDWAPHGTRDGEAAVRILWASHCAECGRAFHATAFPLENPATRRCSEHVTKRPVSTRKRNAQ